MMLNWGGDCTDKLGMMGNPSPRRYPSEIFAVKPKDGFLGFRLEGIGGQHVSHEKRVKSDFSVITVLAGSERQED